MKISSGPSVIVRELRGREAYVKPALMPMWASIDIRISPPQVALQFDGGGVLRNRWVILAVLFVVRLTMPFQFQSVAAVAPLLGREFGVGLADIGVLIGLYFAPGVALALPGGAIGQKFGDKTTVLGALLLMLIGGLAMALSHSWEAQIAGRLVAGSGGVLLNVLMSKMLTDWFAGKEISTAMAIYVTSWPVGVALSLLVLPAIGTAYGTSAAYLAVLALIGSGIILLGLAYQPPAHSATAAAASAWPDRNAAAAVIAAGLIWGLYNAGFATAFSFGPAMLVERGWSISAAGSATSIVLWLGLLSVPAGGYLADRTNRPQFVLVAGCIMTAVLTAALPRSGAVIATVVVFGLLSGLPAGPMMSLPARVLAPSTRAIGMGLFFAVYYGVMMLGPALAGACAKWAGSAAAAFDFGAAVILTCPVVLWGFNRIPPAVPKLA